MTCRECQYPNPRGAIFCLECGGTLHHEQHDATRAMPSTALLHTRLRSPNRTCAVNSPSERLLRATVLDNGRQITLPIKAGAVIGRYDRSRDVQPEIDLSDDGGYDGGVSRRHAHIFQADGAIYIEDLGSANGTFMDDRQLAPHTRYALHSNATLRFGSIALRIDHI